MAGEITGYNKARGYNIYRNHSPVSYNFDRFKNPVLAQCNGLGPHVAQGSPGCQCPRAQALRQVQQGPRHRCCVVPPATTAP